MRRLLTIGLIGFTAQLQASDFGLPFVNSSSLGVAYADWATAAADPSTAYTNPAGLTELHKPQVMLNILGIDGTTKFTGTSVTPPFPFPFPVVETGVARSNIGALMPSFYFSAPIINEKLTFGFNITPPFGLGTNYDDSTLVRYAATLSQVKTIDFGPSLGYKINDNLSIGAGLDAVYLSVTLNNMYGPPLSFPGDSYLQNHLTGWGYGWHAGALLKLASKTRLGLSFNSDLSFNTLGYSSVSPAFGGEFRTPVQAINATLPARTQFSAQQDLGERWTAMATVFYTHWQTFKQVLMQRTATPMGIFLPVTIPFNYHNTFDYAFGGSYQLNSQWKFRAGILFLNTPSNDIDRGVADPIGKATVVTIGTRFQPNAHLWYDVGLGHSFFKQMPINYANPIASLKGHTNTQTSALGGQATWQFD